MSDLSQAQPALRQQLLQLITDTSEGLWCAQWMSGIEMQLHAEGGVWEILGRAIGWPTGYEHDDDFAWVTWDEAAAIFAERRSKEVAR